MSVRPPISVCILNELGPGIQQSLTTSTMGPREPHEVSLGGPDLIPGEASPLLVTQAVSSSRKNVSFKDSNPNSYIFKAFLPLYLI